MIWKRILPAAILCLFMTGCAQVVMLGYLIGGPPSIEPDFDKKTNISLSEKGRKVLVMCYAPKEVKWDFDSVDKELGVHVTHRLNQNQIKVMDPEAVNSWLDTHADWDQPEEIGRDFEVDFVVVIEIRKFGLYEQGSKDLFRGNSEISLSVFEMEKNGEGNEIYDKEVVSKFPIHQPVQTSETSYYDFKQLYLSRLSDEIGRHFYDHYAGDDIPHGGI
ncbi:MAG: hypothetical protein JWM11_3109 [Planctomycetaceae bacterium]|nr:hypothetical protein [Planctomycetaceae bacterium]